MNIRYFFTLLLVFFCSCEVTGPLRNAAFKAGGYEATKRVLTSDPNNLDEVLFVRDSIDTLLAEDEVLFEAVEKWYAGQKGKLKLDPIELELIEDLAIIPLWTKLKEKYGGVKLDLLNPQVRADIVAFRDGMELALDGRDT